MPNFRLHINRHDDTAEDWPYEADSPRGALLTAARRMTDYTPADMGVVLDEGGQVVGHNALRGR